MYQWFRNLSLNSLLCKRRIMGYVGGYKPLMIGVKVGFLYFVLRRKMHVMENTLALVWTE